MKNGTEERNVRMIEEWLETGCTLKSIAKKNNIAPCTVDYAIRNFMHSKMRDVYPKEVKWNGLNEWMKQNSGMVLAELRARFTAPLSERVAIRIAADKRGMTTLEWVSEAIKEKLKREST